MVRRKRGGHSSAAEARRLRRRIAVLEQKLTARTPAPDHSFANEERFRRLVELFPNAVAECDAAGDITFANAAFAALTGRSQGGLLGRPVAEFLETEADRTDFACPPAGAGPSASTPAPRLWRVVMHDGGRRDVEVDWIGVADDEGAPAGNILVVTDISGRMRTERQIKEAGARAERDNEAKSRFLAAASHDLRQPLQALEFFIEALSNRISDKEALDIIGDMDRSLRSARALLTALLDLSKLDIGGVQQIIRDFPVATVLDALAREIAQQAREKGLDFRVIPSSAVVRSDPELLSAILRNLLANALLYTDSGRILLGCRRHGDALRIEVWDSGRGVSAEEMGAIFDEFYRVDDGAGDAGSGCGLGLAIVDRLARLLGHPLLTASTPGRGSMFAIVVPLGSAEFDGGAVRRGPRPEPIAAAAHGALVVVVDDDPDILKLLRRVLEDWQYEVVSAATIDKALEELAGRGRTPDLVIADYKLRGKVTGFDAVDRLRQAWGAALSGIILTGDTAPERAEEAAGNDCFLLQKPVQRARLRAVLRFVLEGREGAPAAPSRR